MNRTQQCPVMPDYCFLSAEAANWLLDTVEGVTGVSEASDILQVCSIEKDIAIWYVIKA